jgi:adenosylcobinamide-phosphate synthase
MTVNRFWVAGAALLVDRVVGDPMIPPHPVILMGRYIHWFDRRFNHPQRPGNRWAGIALLASTGLLFGGSAWALIWAVDRLSPLAAVLLNLWLIATTVAWKGLADAGIDVWRALTGQGLEAGRRAVARVVGRDTDRLDEAGVVRAGVETLAENIVDAVVAPLFFAVLGGAPAALSYRAVNTLDAMVGHRSDRYRRFGWASARCDDLLNWIPARLTVILVAAAAALTGADGGHAWRIARRDGSHHPSPNSGWAEAAMAGALHVQLGGVNWYQGVADARPPLGDPDRTLHPQHLRDAVRIVHATAWLVVGLLAVGGLWS